MSAIGPKRTWPSALHMSAFGGIADMTFCELRRTAAHNLARRRMPTRYDQLGARTNWAAAMPIPRRVIPKTPPIGQRRCPACGLPLFLVAVNPTEVAGEDERVFECTECAYAEMVIVQFR
jgi:hypothetical protein